MGAISYEQAKQIYESFTDDFAVKVLARYWTFHYMVTARNVAERRAMKQLYRRHKRLFANINARYDAASKPTQQLSNLYPGAWEEVVTRAEAYFLSRGMPIFDMEAVRKQARTA